MKLVRLIAALAGAAAVALPLLAAGQQKSGLGKREYDANCAVLPRRRAEGATGRTCAYFGLIGGKTSVADLTTLAKRNNGAFPFTRVYEFIDGTQTREGTRHARHAHLGRRLQGQRRRVLRRRSLRSGGLCARPHPCVDRVRLSVTSEVSVCVAAATALSVRSWPRDAARAAPAAP